MKKFKTLLLVGGLSAILCACGLSGGRVDTTTVSFSKDGTITETIVEDFSQPYYDMEELKGDITSEISAYNTQAGDAEAIVLGDVELGDNNVIRVEMEFKSCADYKTFNEKELFWGTVADAYGAGYEFTSMRDVNQDGVVLSAADVLEKGDMHIVILEEAQQIIVPGKISYISDGVSVIEEKRAVNLNEGQKAFIIYE
ncbi:MAG: hypothetical protein E7289_00310 [Lachnospiraceae bacterium]|nr:hypothetical protein [Lachnospiraceae bacterium]